MPVAEHRPGYDEVFTVTEYYDGPCQGIANFRGRAHFYDFDEAKENDAEELEIDSDAGPVVAKFGAGEEADEDPRCKGAAGGGVGSEEQDGEPAGGDGEQEEMRAGEDGERDGESGDEDRGEKEAIFHGRGMRGSMEGESMTLRAGCQDCLDCGPRFSS